MLACATACSPYNFQKEVNAFSGSVENLSDAVVEGYSSLASDREAQAQLQLTHARPQLVVAPNCAIGASASDDFCDVTVVRGQQPNLLGSSDEQRAKAKALEVLPALKDYAHALAAVTNAEDRAAFDKAVSQLSNSVGDLTKAADVAAPGASVIAPAAVDLAGWLVGTGLDQDRFDSLRRGVHAAQRPIQNIAATLGTGLELISTQRRDIIFKDIEGTLKPMGPSLSEEAYREQLADAEAKFAVLNGLRRSDPAGAAESMAKAHDALVAAVDDPNRNYGNLLKALTDFTNKASALRDALATPSTLGNGSSQKGN